MLEGLGIVRDVYLPFFFKSYFSVQFICCLDGARIGIQYETSFAGTSRAIV